MPEMFVKLPLSSWCRSLIRCLYYSVTDALLILGSAALILALWHRNFIF